MHNPKEIEEQNEYWNEIVCMAHMNFENCVIYSRNS